VSGFVRNLRDGRVEVFAMATPQQHAELRTMLERGPRFSSVSAVQEESANPDRSTKADSLSIPAFERYEYEGMARRGDVRMNDLKKLIREVPDYPKPGILFYDLTTLLKDKLGFHMLIDRLCEHYVGRTIDVVAGIEARGFIFAPLWRTDSTQVSFPFENRRNSPPRPSASPMPWNTARTRSKSTKTP